MQLQPVLLLKMKEEQHVARLLKIDGLVGETGRKTALGIQEAK